MRANPLPSIEDPVYRAILEEVMQPYLEDARKWWSTYEYASFSGESRGIVEGSTLGFFVRIVRTPLQSPIHGIQAFPLVALSYMKFPYGMRKGHVQIVFHICKNGITIDEFTIISKKGLNGAESLGHYLAIIPTRIIEQKTQTRWVYMTPNEIKEVANGMLPSSFAERVNEISKTYIDKAIP